MLYIVPTPIGNLEDITLRALRILKEADLILAEDTRTSGLLLKHFDIKNHLLSYHKFNEHREVNALLKRLKAGETMALVSDAGTPGISDPGFLIARTCREAGVKVQCLPGATAFVPALVTGGIPCDRFIFEGFLPRKKGRTGRLEALKNEERTVVFYESPYRIVRLLEQIGEVMGRDRLVAAVREISKIHEECVRGTVEEVAEHFRENEPKGEFVVIMNGCAK